MRIWTGPEIKDLFYGYSVFTDLCDHIGRINLETRNAYNDITSRMYMYI